MSQNSQKKVSARNSFFCRCAFFSMSSLNGPFLKEVTQVKIKHNIINKKLVFLVLGAYKELLHELNLYIYIYIYIG